jgi:hypothetical protein
MSFCAGFYYYQGEVKNARKMQLAGGRGQQAARGQRSGVRDQGSDDRGQDKLIRELEN